MRLITRLAEDADAALAAISAASAVARERVWNWAEAPTQDGQVVIDLDATLLTARLDKEERHPELEEDLPTAARLRRWSRCTIGE